MSSTELKVIPNIKIRPIGEYDFVWNRIDIGVEEVIYQDIGVGRPYPGDCPYARYPGDCPYARKLVCLLA